MIDLLADANTAAILHIVFCIIDPAYVIFGSIYYTDRVSLTIASILNTWTEPRSLTIAFTLSIWTELRSVLANSVDLHWLLIII